MNYRRDPKTGDQVLQSVTMELCDWLFRATGRDNRMLTYDRRDFDLGVLEKRPYELARAHCGRQAGFRIGLDKLRRRMGSEMPLRNFRVRLANIAEQKDPLPEYGFRLVTRDPPARDGRRTNTNLSRVMVVFWRLDRWREYDAERFPEVDEISFE